LVDEYETEFGLPQQTSQRPFSLRELIAFLDSVKDYGADPRWRRFGFPLVYNAGPGHERPDFSNDSVEVVATESG
jgi:hypothetical protein